MKGKPSNFMVVVIFVCVCNKASKRVLRVLVDFVVYPLTCVCWSCCVAGAQQSLFVSWFVTVDCELLKVDPLRCKFSARDAWHCERAWARPNHGPRQGAYR